MRATVVHSDACHFCDDARRALSQLAAEFPLQVELIDALSPEGRRLVMAHRAGMYPLVLLDDEYFSAGRLPRAKLRQLLRSRAVRDR
jgi:hypothetical protein